jgi:hypothetical protein
MKWWEDPTPARKSCGTVEYASVYPEIHGLKRVLHRGNKLLHVGYTSDRMIPCRCGHFPVLEQYVGDMDEAGIRNIPAKSFVAICPKCEMKAVGHGSLERGIRAWNARRYTPDTVMVGRRLTDADMRGCEALSNRVLSDAVIEASGYVKRKHDVMEKLRGKLDDDAREIHYGELQRIRAALMKLAAFFHESPLVFNHDEEAILSGIRRSVYPDMTIEERLKIPLDLLRM